MVDLTRRPTCIYIHPPVRNPLIRGLKSGKVLILKAPLVTHITIKGIPRRVKPNNIKFEGGLMVILQTIMGFIMGFYLMVIVIGH